METTVRDRYIGQSYWDTHYSAKSCTVLRNIPLWYEKEKKKMLNTLAKEIFLHIIYA